MHTEMFRCYSLSGHMFTVREAYTGQMQTKPGKVIPTQVCAGHVQGIAAMRGEQQPCTSFARRKCDSYSFPDPNSLTLTVACEVITSPEL